MSHHHGINDLHGLHAYCNRNHRHHAGERFGRLFADAPPLYSDPRILEQVGAPGGPMDAGATNDRTHTVAVGQVFFGQFVDHDITLDVTSSFDRVNDPTEIGNARTPTLDLDCIYGNGPEANPYLFHPDGPFAGVKLVTGADLSTDPLAMQDLARVGPVALIGDPRNDENRVISQIQLAMIRFHNAQVDALAADHEGHELFEEARRVTTWHYQWNVVKDFLVKLCGEGPVNRILAEGRRVYRPDVPFIPVEFSVAAYRFGHSMVPMKLQVQQSGSDFELFGAVLGGGFTPLSDARAVVDMHEIFDTSEGRSVQRAQKLDTKMAGDLLALPFISAPSERSLATRNMIRGQSFLLPSGEELARRCGRPEAEIAQVSAAGVAATGGILTGGMPLWYYLLTEAEVIGREDATGATEQGEGLGPLGAVIVAETIIGLLELDPRSWLGANRNWRPMDAYTGIGNMLASAQP